jgi:hypothetical protein
MAPLFPLIDRQGAARPLSYTTQPEALALKLQPVTVAGQRPPEPPWPSGQRTGRCRDGGVQTDKRGIKVWAAGCRGGLTQHGLSACMPRALPSPATPGQPPPSSQPVPGRRGEGGGVTVAKGLPGLPPAAQHPNVAI